MKSASELHCLFCGRPAPVVRRLIQGPDGCICDACVSLAKQEIDAQDVADGIIGDTVSGELHARHRLDCLKLAVANHGARRDEAATIASAQIFTAYVMSGATPDTKVLEHV